MSLAPLPAIEVHIKDGDYVTDLALDEPRLLNKDLARLRMKVSSSITLLFVWQRELEKRYELWVEKRDRSE